jgi:lysophospholipase L1-like esterase
MSTSLRLPSLAALTVVLASACSGGADPADTDGTETGDPTQGSVSASASASATASVTATGTASTTGTGTTADSAAPDATTATSLDPATSEATADPDGTGDDTTGSAPTEPGIHWVGRHDDSDPAAVRMGWSGVGLVARFDGTAMSVRMNDQSEYFTVVVDGVVQPPLSTAQGVQDYLLAWGLPPGEHVVELYRRTEGSFGPTVVHDVAIEGELLPPPPVGRRIEIVGDSITAGYGNEGIDPCGFSAFTENHYMTYGAIAARALGAELHMIAWSGKGVVHNYGGDVFETMPELYDRAVPTEPGDWSFEWQPDVVVVNLGTNDFNTHADPPAELFVGTYVEFAARLRSVYPQAFILLLQPTLVGAEAVMVQGYIEDVVSQRHADGDAAIAYANVNVDWIGAGCNNHPTVATHEGMAERLVDALQSHLGW